MMPDSEFEEWFARLRADGKRVQLGVVLVGCFGLLVAVLLGLSLGWIA